MYNYIKYFERDDTANLDNVIKKQIQKEYNNHHEVKNHLNRIEANEKLIKSLKEYK